jgi:type I restriction enzyme S subunit
MPNTTLEKWEEKILEELCYIEIGKTPSRSCSKFWDEKCTTNNTWVSIADLNNTQNKKVFSSKEQISDLAIQHMKLVKEGTLLLSFKLTIGRVAFAGKDLYTNEAIAQLPIKNEQKIDKHYLYYYFQYFDYDELLKGDVKVKGKTLNKGKLKVLPVCYPPLPEQERIVGILDKAFDEIDQVKANAEQTLTNAKELLESFLSKAFTENTEDWEERTLGETCRISAGGDKPYPYSKEKTNECTVPIYSNGIENNGLYGYTNQPTITQPAVTVSARGTIGFVCKREKPYCPIVRLISLIPNKDILLDFLLYATKFMLPTGNGSSIPQLTIPDFKVRIIKYPSIMEQKQIVLKLDSLQEQIRKLEQIYTQKIKECDELKQSILQKAFRGEL